MIWHTVSNTLIQSDGAEYQISRGPGTASGTFTYRAWHRKTNGILATVNCVDEHAERAKAVAECKAACEAHSV